MKDIILDEQAFKVAVDSLEKIDTDLGSLVTTINQIITTLKTGFDTPAGEKLYNSVDQNLIKSISNEQKTITHIKANLETAKSEYASVFSSFETLNKSIKQ
ncbi:hypothetical protein FACS1894132_06030 [Clostridia bacterium]|nr:hypothetical protein FACS1894132_06030 [Clostridia bacterium]